MLLRDFLRAGFQKEDKDAKKQIYEECQHTITIEADQPWHCLQPLVEATKQYRILDSCNGKLNLKFVEYS